MSRDGRGRLLSAPPVLSYGFRPFFLLAALYAGFAIPFWLLMITAGYAPSGPFAGAAWHAHEMLFGYLGAVIAGFVLTAVPNWTGSLPLSGPPLAVLAMLWLAGRIATATLGNPYAAMALDVAFPALLAASVWREVIAGRNWRNMPMAVMLTLFGLANAAHYGEALGIIPEQASIRLALAVAAMLIALIGGRIVPSFTRNWLAKAGSQDLPASHDRLDTTALLANGGALSAWVAAPGSAAAGVSLMLAGTLLGFRLSRWSGRLIWREPMLLILHLGYGWLALSLVLIGCATLAPAVLPDSAALHALTAGAIGTMTLAVMTRASLGHTGRPITASATTLTIFGAVQFGALLRVAAPVLPDFMLALAAGGMLWSLAFLLFALSYGPMLCQPRLPG